MIRNEISSFSRAWKSPGRKTLTGGSRLFSFSRGLIGLAVLVGITLQSPAVFLGLWAVLWWSALLPRLNPFDALYNVTLGARPGAIRLRAAPAPRRFAQGMAGTFALAIGAMLRLEWFITATVLEVFLGAAIAALIFGRFCLGSYIYHLLRGETDFAAKTLPWSHR